MTGQELEAVTIVAFSDRFTGDAVLIQNPRAIYDKCEGIWSRHGKSSLTHSLYCMHCQDLIGACYDAALEANLVLEISRFDEPVEETHDFAIIG